MREDLTQRRKHARDNVSDWRDWLPKRDTNTNSRMENPVGQEFSSLLTTWGKSEMRSSRMEVSPGDSVAEWLPVFKVATLQLCSSSRWFTRPVTCASSRTHLLSRTVNEHHTLSRAETVRCMSWLYGQSLLRVTATDRSDRNALLRWRTPEPLTAHAALSMGSCHVQNPILVVGHRRVAVRRVEGANLPPGHGGAFTFRLVREIDPGNLEHVGF